MRGPFRSAEWIHKCRAGHRLHRRPCRRSRPESRRQWKGRSPRPSACRKGVRTWAASARSGCGGDSTLPCRPANAPWSVLQTRPRPNRSSSYVHSFFQYLARNDDAHDFIRSFQNLVYPGITHQTLQWVILQVTIAAMQLLGIQAYLETEVSRHAFGHGAIYAGLRVLGIEHVGSQPDHLARRHDVGEHVGELELKCLEGGQGLGELLTLLQVMASRIVSALCGTHGARADVDAPTVQPLHGEDEALPFFPQQILCGHFHVLEGDGPGGLAVPAHFFFLTAVTDAGGVGRHNKG